MPRKDRADSTDRRIEPNDKARREQGRPISRRRFVSGAAALGVAGAIGLPWVLETKDVTAGEKNVGVAADPVAAETGPATEAQRVDQALTVRINAARYERAQPTPAHPNNGDEALYPNKIANFSKGLPHNDLDEVDLAAYNSLLHALATGRPEDFEAIILGGTVKLTDPQAGLAFTLAGPDCAQLVAVPAPAFNSAWVASEIAELYWQALARDVPFAQYGSNQLTQQAARDLSRFSDFRGPKVGGDVSPQTLFRGSTPGDLTGPYISQFLWADIPFGAIPVIQQIRTVVPNVDYLTKYEDWLAIQNGAVAKSENSFDPIPRYIRNGRDMGEWVHRDWPYQHGLHAGLILLAFGATEERNAGSLPPRPQSLTRSGRPLQQEPLLPGSLIFGGAPAPLDQDNPYVNSRTQTGFVTLAAPDILALVADVTVQAMKATWYEKWFVHRRLRPEEFGGRIHNHLTGRASYPIHADILNSAALKSVFGKFGTYLLPLAFPEGCPTHPAYTAGHATAAGAACTVLKALFDESFVIPHPVVPTEDGLSLVPFEGPELTVGGELNKLASNIAIGRNFAGVHYRTDATESLKLGEEFAIRFLRELKLTYNEAFPGFALTKFDGSAIVVTAPPGTAAVAPLGIDMSISTEESVRVVDISIANNTGGGIAELEIRGAIPSGGHLVSANPVAFTMQGNEVVWLHLAGMGPGQRLSGFQYKFSGGTGNPVVTVKYFGQSSGSASTG